MQSLNKLLWDKLQSAASADRLGHALLFKHASQEKAQEVFKQELYEFCAYLQCDQKNGAAGAACGACDSCRAYAQTKNLSEVTHPDLFFLEPQALGSSYSVEQVRTLGTQFSLRRALSPLRIAVISDAEYLSWTQAGPANALLKLLEEPRPDSFLILTTSRSEGILKTLQSRCQAFRFLAAAHKDDYAWPTDWKEFSQWIEGGLPAHSPAKNPADQESFWKDRTQAFEELKNIFVSSYHSFREKLGSLSLTEARKGFEFLGLWQDMLLQSRFHIQGHLHWLEIQKAIRR